MVKLKHEIRPDGTFDWAIADVDPTTGAVRLVRHFQLHSEGPLGTIYRQEWFIDPERYEELFEVIRKLAAESIAKTELLTREEAVREAWEDYADYKDYSNDD